jgi:N-acetyl-alpha-D-muramate 1-phosphate uridylyltransferase
MKAMLLAAGRGERLRPLTDSLPKPLVRVGGRPLIAWHLARLSQAGVREVVVNLSWLGEQLRAALGDGREFGVRINWSEEGPVPLETGGGILKALPLLAPGPFLVVSSDIWTDIDFASIRIPEESRAHLVLIGNPPHHPRGDFGLEDGRVVEREVDRLTYANVGVYRAELFDGFAPGRFPLLSVLKPAITAQQVSGEIHRGAWCDVGTRERLADLEKSLQSAVR